MVRRIYDEVGQNGHRVAFLPQEWGKKATLTSTLQLKFVPEWCIFCDVLIINCLHDTYLNIPKSLGADRT